MPLESSQSMSSTTAWAEFGYLYEQEGARLLRKSAAAAAIDDLHQGRQNFLEAFKAWTQFAKASKGNLERPGRGAGDEITKFRSGLDPELVRTDLLLAFRLCVSGLLSASVIDMRTEVEKFSSVRAKGRFDYLIKIFVELNGAAPRAKLIASWLDEYKTLQGKTRQSDPALAATSGGLDVLVQLLADVSRSIFDTTRSESGPSHLMDAQKRAEALFAAAPAAEFLRHLCLLLVLSLHEMIHGYRSSGKSARKEISFPPVPRSSSALRSGS